MEPATVVDGVNPAGNDTTVAVSVVYQEKGPVPVAVNGVAVENWQRVTGEVTPGGGEIPVAVMCTFFTLWVL